MNFTSKTKRIFFSIITNLTFWVLIAILLGIFVGHDHPDTGVRMKIVGDGFISIIKVFIIPIIFLTIYLMQIDS
jgi:aerobic C4-dicarboxylate transport protein